MNRNKLYGLLMAGCIFLVSGCGEGTSKISGDNGNTGFQEQSSQPPPKNSSDWLIEKDEVLNGGVGMDGIPALTKPPVMSKNEADNNLDGPDLVVGVVIDGEARAYPHRILDWHEIINDTISSTAFALTYCPLTGSAIGLSREINGVETTFGVSGLLYNSNLILYDRLTRSYWSQMKMLSITGPLIGEKFELIPIVETKWATWRELYPDTKVVSEQTGHNLPYSIYPYGMYRTTDNLIFPVGNLDRRLHLKERVHGLRIDDRALAFVIESFHEEIHTINHTFNSVDIITAGSSDRNFAISFERELGGELLTFVPVQDSPPGIMSDSATGSHWNIFGTCIDGPSEGKQLKPVVSYIAYWFAWASFYPETEIYNW